MNEQCKKCEWRMRAVDCHGKTLRHFCYYVLDTSTTDLPDKAGDCHFFEHKSKTPDLPVFAELIPELSNNHKN